MTDVLLVPGCGTRAPSTGSRTGSASAASAVANLLNGLNLNLLGGALLNVLTTLLNNLVAALAGL